MKKIIIVCCFLLTGCFSSAVGPKETVDAISDQKLAATKISVQSILALVNQKYLLEPKTFSKQENFYCISVTKLDVNDEFKSGLVCINNAGQTKAIDVVYGNYICSGSSNNMECEKVDK